MRISPMQAELFITLLEFGLIKAGTFKTQKQFYNFNNKKTFKAYLLILISKYLFF